MGLGSLGRGLSLNRPRVSGKLPNGSGGSQISINGPGGRWGREGSQPLLPAQGLLWRPAESPGPGSPAGAVPTLQPAGTSCLQGGKGGGISTGLGLFPIFKIFFPDLYLVFSQFLGVCLFDGCLLSIFRVYLVFFLFFFWSFLELPFPVLEVFPDFWLFPHFLPF